MDFSEVGQFGTLHLMKRLDPTAVAASYPIDEEEITIGRDPSCSIRLYYESVSTLHCKIIFHERKAFVVVYGTNGLLIDGCPVFPAANPVTVPLPNHSTIEIHKKSFQFCYPPKELRPILLATPPRHQDPVDGKHRRRTLRMSMIQSAQVFTPAPNDNPKENLRILQTPMKTPFRRFAPTEPSPLKRGTAPDLEEEVEEEDEIVLVESNHPKVLEDDKDLVILEHVEVEIVEDEPLPSPRQHMVQYPIPQPAQLPPQLPKTPRRRAHPRNSLHRAVLIRSAQRTALRIEMEAEEEQEVEEVEETIQPMDVDDVEEVNEQDDEEEEAEEPKTATSGWRKSLEVVAGGLAWPFRSSSVNRERGEKEKQDDDLDEEPNMADEGEQTLEDDFDGQYKPEHDHQAVQVYHSEENQSALSTSAPAPPLGKFMTPQIPRITREHARYSVGGFTAGGIRGEGASSGPRRVKLVDPWKLKDIVVPVKAEVKQGDAANPFASPTKRERLSDEERKAILERRRSALTTPDTFAPGIGHLSKRMSVSPTKVPAPLPALNISQTIHEVKDEDDAEQDTSVMLARMKQMVDGVKKRRSMGPRPSVGVSPRKPGQFSLFALDADLTSPQKMSSRLASAEFLGNDAEGTQDLAVGTEDVPMDGSLTTQAADASSSHISVDPSAPATPQFSGMREMFRDAVQEMQTPRMDGMRDLFRSEHIPETPAFEGVGEMLATPAGLRTREPEPEDLAIPEELPGLAPGLSRARKPPSTANPKIPAGSERIAPQSAPAVQMTTGQDTLYSVPEDDIIPAESLQPRGHGTASRVSRRPRSQSAEPKPVPISSRSTRARSAARPEEVSKHSIRKPKAEEEVVGPKSAPVRRARRTAQSPVPSEDPPATKAIRRPRITTKTPKEDIEDEPTRSLKASGSRRRTQPKPVDADEDELDAIPRDDDEKKGTGAKVRRSTRTKVKDEDTEDSPALATVVEEEAVAAPTTGTSRTTRTRKTPSAVTPTARITTRGKATSAKKTVEEAGKTAGSSEKGDKENTPEPTSTEEDPSDGSTTATGGRSTSGGKAVAKVTRSSGRSRATPTVEVEDKGKEALKTRVSRTKVALRK